MRHIIPTSIAGLSDVVDDIFIATIAASFVRLIIDNRSSFWVISPAILVLDPGNVVFRRFENGRQDFDELAITVRMRVAGHNALPDVPSHTFLVGISVAGIMHDGPDIIWATTFHIPGGLYGFALDVQ